MPVPLTIGFDLDMTLFDTRPGVARVWEQLMVETGIVVDVELIVSRLGPPLAEELSNWVPADRTAEFVDVYRSLYAEHAVAASVVMPGAQEALAAVHAAGGRTMLVTAKHAVHAQRHVDHAGLAVDLVVGNLWGEGKGPALAEAGAAAYAGDHVLDVAGARVASATSVGVATGPCSPAELTAAGADVVLADLTEFAPWFEGWLADETRRLDADVSR